MDTILVPYPLDGNVSRFRILVYILYDMLRLSDYLLRNEKTGCDPVPSVESTYRGLPIMTLSQDASWLVAQICDARDALIRWRHIFLHTFLQSRLAFPDPSVMRPLSANAGHMPRHQWLCAKNMSDVLCLSDSDSNR